MLSILVIGLLATYIFAFLALPLTLAIIFVVVSVITILLDIKNVVFYIDDARYVILLRILLIPVSFFVPLLPLIYDIAFGMFFRASREATITLEFLATVNALLLVVPQYTLFVVYFGIMCMVFSAFESTPVDNAGWQTMIYALNEWSNDASLIASLILMLTTLIRMYLERTEKVSTTW